MTGVQTCALPISLTPSLCLIFQEQEASWPISKAEQPFPSTVIKALDVATNVLQRNPNVKAIYCANDTMAMGVAQAVANAGKTGKVLVVGTDGIPEARKMVEAGQMTATVAQNPADIGATGLKLMVDAEKSGKVIPLDKAPQFKLVDSILVTK